MMGRHILSWIILSLSMLLPAARAQGTGTTWSTIMGTDSFNADVFPEGFDGIIDPVNTEQVCKTWCLSVPACTMFLYYVDGTGVCYIKTGAPVKVEYQIGGPQMPYNLVMRDLTCDVSMSLIRPYMQAGDVEPQCIETRGNTDEGEDEVPQGALNEPCLPNNDCLNGNVCDILADGSNICKAPLNGICRDISDCSYTTADPELECTLLGGTNDNRICAIVPRGELNELCLTDNTCFNGNVCDINPDGLNYCKSPLNASCSVVSDCSASIADPELECISQNNQNRACVIVPRGDLNELCLVDNTCRNGNVCDFGADGSRICKSPLSGACDNISDCSSTISDPELECTSLGGTNGSQICAIVPRGALNEQCLTDNTCFDGSVCDIKVDGSTICKSPLSGLCSDISDCSSNIADPELECTSQGATDGDQICAIVPRGDLNELCLPNNTCLDGNICDINADSSTICKAPMNGVCFDISDCSSTIADPELECTSQGGTNGNQICAIVLRGALNELCLTDNTCYDGNVCDSFADGFAICKSSLNGFCRDLSDCSNTITDPDLACTPLGGSDDNRICAIVAAAAPGASQVAERRKRNVIKARIAARLDDQCPKRFIACPMQSGENFECVNPLEELANCGACGTDCQEILGVHETGVSCSQGECLIHRCRKGYKHVGNECIAKRRRLR